MENKLIKKSSKEELKREEKCLSNPSFTSIELEDLKDTKSSEIKIPNEKSPNIFIADNIEQIFSSSPQIFIEFKVESSLEPLNVETVLKILQKLDKKEFVILFRTSRGSSLFYWRVNDTKQVLSLEIEADDELCDFIKVFLLRTVERGENGTLKDVKFNNQQLIIPIDIRLIGDKRGYNLLCLAAEDGNNKVVESLLSHGFMVSFLINGKNPVDIAYEKKHFDVILTLLKANSRFPRDFDCNDIPDDLDKFIETSFLIRFAIQEDEIEKIDEILNSQRNLKYFYTPENESLLTFAIISKKIETYEYLLGKNLLFGPREDLDEIMDNLDVEEQKSLRKVHGEKLVKIEKHLMILMSNSSIICDSSDPRGKLTYVQKAYEYLNKIPAAKSVLKIIAAKRDFEIHFDFNSDTVRFLDPSTNSNTNGLCYMSGRILIGAKNLLDPQKQNEVFGVLIHEMSHFAMCMVYNNFAKPYFDNDLESEERFEEVSKVCEDKKDMEPVIWSVYEDYDSENTHLELIVRSPQLNVLYHENEEKLKESREDFKELHEFFESTTIPDIENAIPRVENQAEEDFKKALKKISNLKKVIGFLIALIIVSIPILYLIFNSTVYKWNDLSIDDQERLLNASVNYHGTKIQLSDLLTNGSEAFEYFKSDSLKNALDGNYEDLSEELSGHLDQFIFLNFLNLSSNFWDRILKSSVSFQGHKVTLSEIATKSSLNELKSDQIKSLLSNESLKIANDIEYDSFYIPRKFVDNHLTINLESVYKIVKSTRIFLLADSPGSGKSITFKFMAKNIKNLYPTHWIQFIELKDQIDVFKSIEDQKPLYILSKMLNLNQLESDLFTELFTNNKVILFWDAVDEISPNYDKTFFTLSKRIYKESENLQFISSRLQNSKDLTENFESNFFTLSPYTKEDRTNFIKEFLGMKEILKEKRIKIFSQVEDFIDNILADESGSLRRDINNPLMLRMLTEIAIDEKLSKSLTNIYEIFNVFVNLKLEVLEGKGTNDRLQVLQTTRLIGIDEVHMIYALKYILGDSFTNYLAKTYVATDSLQIMKKNIDWTNEQVAKFGIMFEKSKNQIDFVHRTFAEFFVAKYLIENIYRASDNPRREEMNLRIVLLHNIAFNIHFRKVIQEFIEKYLKTDRATSKSFEQAIIEVFDHGLSKFQDYFTIFPNAPLFLRFFEKDERIMRILARVNQYENINEWLEVELGIELGNKSSYVENNQLGFILMRSWQFEKSGNKVFADFIRKSTNLTENEILKSEKGSELLKSIAYVEKFLINLENNPEGSKNSTMASKNSFEVLKNLPENKNLSNEPTNMFDSSKSLTVDSNDNFVGFKNLTDSNQNFDNLKNQSASKKLPEDNKSIPEDVELLPERETQSEIPENTTNLFENLSKIKQPSQFINLIQKFLTNDELKSIYINSVHLVDNDLKNENESDFYMENLKKILNHDEIVTTLTKESANGETFFYRALKINNEALNVKMLSLIDENLSNDEIFKLFTKSEKVHESTLMFVAAQYQDYFSFTKFINFTRGHTTEEQFKWILLHGDAENDTLLQYAHFFPYPDNFIFIGKIYLKIFSLKEIHKTFLDRKKLKLPAFAESVKSANVELFNNVAKFLNYVFRNDTEDLVNYLSRRNENGETVFSLYKNVKTYRKHLEPFYKILERLLDPEEIKKLEEKVIL